MFSRKRSHESDTSGAHFLRGFKRPRVSAIRQFPLGCDVAASEVRNEGGTLVKTSKVRSKTEPSISFVEMSRTKLKSNEPVNPPVEKKIPKHIDVLCGSDTSPRPCVISKKYPSPKFRKGITIFREFPRDCGRQLKQVSTKFNCLDVEAVRYNALPDKPNGALSAKQSDALTINSHPEALSRTKEVLDLFEQILKEQLRKIQLEKRFTSKINISNIYTNIAMVLKEQKKWIHMNQKLLGAIPGVKVGDQFRYRAELVVVGLHTQFSSGIDYMEKDGKKIATSIVSSGRYSSDKEFEDVIIYSGQGGNQIMGEKNSKDQELVRGNLALKNSMDEKTPVRVILGRRSLKIGTFVYDGLYLVSKFWQERARNGTLVYMFQLNRKEGQPKLKTSTLQKFGKSKASHCRALMSDISSEKRKYPSASAGTEPALGRGVVAHPFIRS